MKNGLAGWFCTALLVSAGMAFGRETVELNREWRFARFGAMPDGSIAAEPKELQHPAVDDATWRTVNLPHDWGIEGPFRAELPNNTGKLPWAGIGWYRKTVDLPAEDRNKRIYIEIDGAMQQPEIFVNGTKAGEWKYGYASFRVDLTPHLRFGAQNLIAIRLNNPENSSRWYPGGGIYRDVRLLKTAAVAVDEWGVFVHTPEIDRQLAVVAIDTTVRNDSQAPQTLLITHRLLDPEGAVAATAKTPPLKLAPGGKFTASAGAGVPNPRLWDIASPGNRYTCETTVTVNGAAVDTCSTAFGIRTVAWDANEGFKLNGRVVKLQGVCQHHDLGALGAAFNDRAAERQLEILREMGCNSVRTSHNMPAPRLLDLCDRMGILVMNESFDCWEAGKTPNDYGQFYNEWHARDVSNFVRRDRNHPSVIIWSAGNEIKEQGKKNGVAMAKELVELFKKDDPSRLVTCGNNHSVSIKNGFAAAFDVAGYNYKAIGAKQDGNYNDHIKANPGQPFVGAENSSCVSSRGVYFFPVSEDKKGGFFRFQVSSYDLYAPAWAYRPDYDFESEDRLPALAGQYVWTGFDYLGEPTPYNKDETNLLNFQNEEERQAMEAQMAALGGKAPSRSSYFGIIDLAGFPKDRYYLYQARWRPDLPMVHILPHWNWQGREGEITPVHVYTSGDEAELFLNGKSLGKKKKGPYEYRLRWNEVQYQPGELKAVAFKSGKPWAEQVMKTTAAAAQLAARADRSVIRADARDLAFVTVQIADRNGLMVPTANDLIEFQLEGPGEIVGLDNGDASSHESFQGLRHSAFNGLALAIVRAKEGQPGTITLTAKAQGLAPATVTIKAE